MKRKANKQTETDWKAQKTGNYYFGLIERYFRDRKQPDNTYVLNDRMCNDLDFEEFFMFADRCLSCYGQQYLYAALRTPPANQQPPFPEALINSFRNNSKLRAFFEKTLQKHRKNEAYYLSDLFTKSYLKPPSWFWVIPLLSVAFILSLIATIVHINFVFVFIPVLITNVVLHYWNKQNLQVYADALPQLFSMLSAARKLARNENFSTVPINVDQSLKALLPLRKRLAFVNFAQRFDSELMAIVWWLVEVVKMVILIEPMQLFYLIKKLEGKQNEIEQVFQFVGIADGSYSIAALREGLSVWCNPDFSAHNTSVSFTGLYHPLVPFCVDNDIKTFKSVLITGSNMSGKTTFIRSIGLSVLAAQTLNTCFAQTFSSPPVELHTAIRISDDLMNDKSYYLAEITSIGEMIKTSRKTGIRLFLLDELFKGTNTIERVAAGKAVLSYLSKGNFVFLSTHDVELVHLLQGQYEMHHFSELVEENQLAFDYKLKQGAVSEGNAIRILGLYGYPAEIISEAMDLANKRHG